MACLQMALLALAVTSGEEPVLLDFYADWCAPCRQMDPTVRQLTDLGYPIRRVNVDRNRALAAKYGVQGIPCFVMVVDGKEADRVEGATSFGRLERMCRTAAASRRKTPVPVRLTGATTPKTPAVPIPATASDPPFATTWPKAAASETVSSEMSTNGTAGWRVSPVASATLPPASSDAGDKRFDAQLIAATVRLRIEDAGGRSCGTGTIIDARKGEALILTCGHIFRESEGKGPIEVDLFGAVPGQKIPGRLISYDLKRDVGLVAVKTPGPLTAVPVAAAGYRLKAGDPVISVGCNNGDRPTALHSRVKSLDKFLGPPNIQVAGLPVEGRSGGGLFSADGLLIGVCNAADPADREGLYAALATVHGELEKTGLSYVVRSDETPPARTPLVAIDPPAMLKEMPTQSEAGRLATVRPRSDNIQSTSARTDRSTTLAAHEQAALDEIGRRRAEGAEVVCIIRSRANPHAKSEIIVLDDVSPEFLRRLQASRSAPNAR